MACPHCLPPAFPKGSTWREFEKIRISCKHQVKNFNLEYMFKDRILIKNHLYWLRNNYKSQKKHSIFYISLFRDIQKERFYQRFYLEIVLRQISKNKKIFALFSVYFAWASPTYVVCTAGLRKIATLFFDEFQTAACSPIDWFLYGSANKN